MKTYELFEMSKEQLCNYIKELEQENQKLRKVIQNIKEQATILIIPTTAEKIKPKEEFIPVIEKPTKVEFVNKDGELKSFNAVEIIEKKKIKNSEKYYKT